MGEPALSERIIATARRMALQALAAEVSDALMEQGIESLLLKGPITALWLFGDRQARDYRDVDLLVRPEQFRAAVDVVTRLGFVDLHRASLTYYESENEVTFIRDSLCLDLHFSIVGIPSVRTSESVSGLFASSVYMDVAPNRFRTLSIPDRVAHLAWHVAQSPHDIRALRDLDRGLVVLDRSGWRAGASVARQRGGLDAFVAGLCQREGGAAIVRDLELSAVRSIDVQLRVSGASHDARALLRVWRSRSRLRGAARALHVGRSGIPQSELPTARQRTRLRLTALARVPVALLQILRAYAGLRSSNHRR